MHKLFKTSWLALLNGLLLALPLMTYTTVNDVRQPWVLLSFLIVISVLVIGHTLWPRLSPLWWLLYGFSLILGCYASYPLDLSLSLTWGQRFLHKLIQQTQAFQAATSTQAMPVLLSMLLIMALAIGLTSLAVRWQQPLLSIGVSVGYLLAVALFATRNETLPLIGVLGLAVLLGLARTNQVWSRYQLLYGLGVLLILGVGATATTWAHPVITHLASATLTWRNQLSSRGFYNFLAKSAAAKKTGISEDTATLGGAIQDDNSVAFKALSPTSHYWRVDTRTTYSGKGWTMPDDPATVRKPTTTSTGYLQSPTSPKTALKLTLPKTATYLPVGYGTTTWAVSARQQQRFGISYSRSRGRTYLNTGRQRLTSIRYQYQPQQYTAAQLTAVTTKPKQRFIKTNTRLPKTLPKRIKTLSQKVTKNQTTEYGRVQAVLTYLKNDRRFDYTKLDTPTTPAKRDYVDYFLFTSRRGYCDNFSTSLVVMLRTLGIPARWADGFSGGTRGKAAANGQYHYQILNSDAHSWAEVYFAGIGWVPFDPTPGYQNPGTKKAKPKAATKASSSSTPATSSSSSSSNQTASQSQRSQSSSTTTSHSQSTTTRRHATNKTWQPFKTTWVRLALGLSLLGLIGLAWLNRYWLGLIGLSFMLATKLGRPTRQYRYLQAWFEHQQPRQSAESLSAYAATVEQRWPQLAGHFATATHTYLAVSFGHHPATPLTAQLALVVQSLRKNRKPTPL